MIKRTYTLLLIILSINMAGADEGMWPISEINRLQLESKGMQLTSKELFNPDGISLVDGICKVGGCSGAFVSSQGLILTNHHCAFYAIQSASCTESDYLANGFLATSKSEEIHAEGYTVRITESYEDVSEAVLSVIKPEMSPEERTRAIEKKSKQLSLDAETRFPGKRAEMAEMYPGKSYVLFIYTYIKDVRLVYAPPKSIGNFGGETDNWIWPRHTGDFTYMRAYVGPDGEPAEYSPQNIPYNPKKVIKVNPDGVQEEDFVFILGYPGRTYRHKPARFLDFETTVRMPYVVDLYDWQIQELQKAGQSDPDLALKFQSRIKGRSNTYKNYLGKLQGIKRLDLVSGSYDQQQNLIKFIEKNPELKTRNKNLFKEIDKVFDEKLNNAHYEFFLYYLKRSVNLFNLAFTIYEASLELPKDDIERKSSYMNRNYDLTRKRLELDMHNYNAAIDKLFFKDMLEKMFTLPEDQQLEYFTSKIKSSTRSDDLDSFLHSLYSGTKLDDPEYVKELFNRNNEELLKVDDPVLKMVIELYPIYDELDKTKKARKGKLDRLYADLVDLKKEFLEKDFTPDANRTLRLTYGYIRGYSPNDAIYYSPLTSLDGVIQKTTGIPPFVSPRGLVNLHKQKDYGRYYNKKLNSVPVNLLYNLDTTGGNSGSALLNARGELIGINFDRAFEATINDFAWSESYSRSIAVDIRYVLWITEKFGNADYLLEEMEVKK